MAVASKILRLIIALPLLGAAWTGLSAAETDEGPSQQLRVHGDIASHCSISSPSNVELGDLESQGLEAKLKFGLDCNVPYVMKVQADHGALTNREYPMGQGPYSGSLPYNLQFTIPARSPAPLVITRTLRGEDLVAGRSISSRGAISTDGMEVRVTFGRAKSDAGLLAGDYGETITISLASI